MLSAAFLFILLLLRFFQIDGIMNRASYTARLSYKQPIWEHRNTLSQHDKSERAQSNVNGDTFALNLRRKKGSTIMTFTTKNSELPFFDTDFLPIFIYSMPRGELIINTMLNSKKYSLAEPVPGQVLYPPTVPLFKRIPIVLDNSQISTTTAIPQVYKPSPWSYSTSRRSTNKSQGGNKHTYVAYKSPDEVNWQPYLDQKGICNTPSEFVPSSSKNHRSPTYFEPTEAISTTHNNDIYENNERLHIFYEEEEKDVTTNSYPKLSSRYSVAKKDSSYPVFSLGKMLNTSKNDYSKVVENAKKKNKEHQKQTNDTDTWFIMNSRYKGHQSKRKLNEAYFVDNYNSMQQYFPKDQSSKLIF